MDERARTSRIRRSLIIVIALALPLLHLLPFIIPKARLWGFNHLIFLPVGFLYIFLALVILALASAFIAPLHRPVYSLYEKAARLLFDQRHSWRWFLTSAAMLPLFYFLRLNMYILGDSIALIANIDQQQPTILKWSESGAIYVADLVAQLIHFVGFGHPADAYVYLSIVSGSVALWFLMALAYELGESAPARLFIFALSFLAGWTLLFFGYVESYPILWPIITGYLYLAVRAIKHRRGWIWAMALFIPAAVLHLQSLFFLLSLAALIWDRMGEARFFKKWWRGRAIAVGTLAGIALAAIVAMLFIRPEIGQYLVPLFDRRPPVWDYWLFSSDHLIDIANQLLLLVPALPLLLAAARPPVWHKIAGIDRLLFWFSAAGLLFLFIVEPKLGMGRDWDLFALAGLGPMLYLTAHVALDDAWRRRFHLLALLLSLTLVLPFWSCYMRGDSAVRAYKYLLNLDLPRSRTGLIELRNLYLIVGDSASADSLSQVVTENFPAYHMVPKAYDLLEQKRFEEALALADTVVRHDGPSAEALNLRGMIYALSGRQDLALADLQKAAAMARYDSRFLSNLGWLYRRLGRYDDMLKTYRRAQKLAPDADDVLKGLTSYFFLVHRYDSAAVYAGRCYDLNPSPDAMYIMGFSAYKLNQFKTARACFLKYLEIGDEEQKRVQVRGFLDSLPQEER